MCTPLEIGMKTGMGERPRLSGLSILILSFPFCLEM